MKKSTSWGNVAKWYDELLEEKEGTYQKELILPNLLRLLDIKKGETILDLACGQGFFARALGKEGAKVIGTDISKELITIAQKNAHQNTSFRVAPSDTLSFIESSSIDKAVIVLALQNIEKINETLQECARVLRPKGALYLVLNHPAFRVPQESDWGYDDKKKVQYRRVDQYCSESKVKIQMHPGDKPSEHTISFHRPLQVYAKAFTKAGLLIRRIEEWNSHKKSEPGPRAEQENRARKEIPLFIMLELIKPL